VEIVYYPSLHRFSLPTGFQSGFLECFERESLGVAVSEDSLAGVVAAGDHRGSLVALRDFLAAQLMVADRDVPALARQLTNVLNEINAVPAPDVESKLDDLESKRAKRRAAASG